MNKQQQHENLLKVIAELEDYAFIFLDVEGNIKTWNLGACKIKGYSSQEITGKNFRCFYTKDDILHKKPDNLLKTATKEGKARDEGWRVRKDGTTFWGSILITAIHDTTGKTIGFGKLTRDLTDKKLAEQAQFMYLKNKELEQFNYIASHDLQEPLRTVSNYIQVLEEDYSQQLPEDAKKHLLTIENATNRMRVLVKSLLDLSRLGRDKEIAVVDCNLLVKTVLADLSNLIETTKSEVTIVYPLPEIMGYETEIRQLFQNLIANAIKFRKKDLPAEVKIGYTEKENCYEFYVQDKGIGIEQKHFERIFQIFQQLHKSGNMEGYGIGLTNCRKIVEIHGGKLWVESEIGKGATFKFTIIKI